MKKLTQLIILCFLIISTLHSMEFNSEFNTEIQISNELSNIANGENLIVIIIEALNELLQ